MANDEHLHKAFSYFDKDGNGYIEPQELQDALMEDGDSDSANVANDIFQEVDTDKVKTNFMNIFSTQIVLDFFNFLFRVGILVRLGNRLFGSEHSYSLDKVI